MPSFDGEVSKSNDSGYIAPFQTTLFILLLLTAIVGNGLFFFLFIRNKSLRTVHHAFFADLAIIDLLNGLINIPLSICYVVYDIPSCRGKTFAWIVSFLHAFFALLSLSSMALQMIDRYLAVCWPIFYKVNKSMVKIIVTVLIKWLVILTIILLIYVPLYDIDIGNSPVLEYRELYARKSGQRLSKYVVPLFFVVILLFGGLSLWNLRKRLGQIGGAPQNARHNSPSTRARKKAVYTILLLLIIALISYLPAVIRSRMWLGLESQRRLWLAFAIIFTASVPSALNPFIVLIRVKLFSDKLKALINVIKSVCADSQADVQNVAEIESGNFPAFRVEIRRISCFDISFVYRSPSCPDMMIASTQIVRKERRKSL